MSQLVAAASLELQVLLELGDPPLHPRNLVGLGLEPLDLLACLVQVFAERVDEPRLHDHDALRGRDGELAGLRTDLEQSVDRREEPAPKDERHHGPEIPGRLGDHCVALTMTSPRRKLRYRCADAHSTTTSNMIETTSLWS